jgi:hypothetical protein
VSCGSHIVQWDVKEIGVFFKIFIPKKYKKMKHERLNNIIFLKYNLKLKMRQKEREKKEDHYNPIELSDMKSDNEWLTRNP